MRIDVISIFPGYLAPLSLSLPGKAQQSGLLDLRVHDLRTWTHDRHHTVDDTPYGGGAGMVMKPEPWGEALDEVVGEDPDVVLVIPTPSGTRFTQRLAEDLAGRSRLVFACGRYEGIDQRVLDHAASRMEVREVSLGDYVLNGGEVAALAVIEAVVRLLPGFMGNPESLVEESHAEGGLLEYPVYTKPVSWRGLEVPPVLLSGDHGRIASWRHEQALRRTVERRPDLAHPSRLVGGEGGPEPELRLVEPADVGELMTLQRACWVQEALAGERLDLPALTETAEEVAGWCDSWAVWVLRLPGSPGAPGRLIGAVRTRLVEPDVWEIGRLMVAPDVQGAGLGRVLLDHAEATAPTEARTFRLATGAANRANQRRYRRWGYRVVGADPSLPDVVRLEKRRR